jgi:hypothetical protein
MDIESEKPTELSVLEQLQKPWSASSLTAKQIQQKQDIVAAKGLWDEVLEEFRKKKEEMILAEAKDVAATKETRDQPFQFLDLIRNLIYDMSMKDD